MFTPAQIAAQLRQPSGEFGIKVAQKMNTSNIGLYELVLDCLKPQDGDHILEIGFGNGVLFDLLFGLAPNAHVTGVEYAETMLEQAQANAAPWIEKGSLNLVYGDSNHLPFANASFDKVYGINLIYFWEEPSLHLSEIKRVLKPGGIFLAGIRTKATISALPFAPYGFRFYEPEEWNAILLDNGFTPLLTVYGKEADTEFDGVTYPLENLCLAGQT